MRIVLARVIALALLLSSVQPLRAISPNAPSHVPHAPATTLIYDEPFTSYANKASIRQVEWNIWDGRLEVKPYEGYFARMAENAIATDSQGNAVVVWFDERNSQNGADIYAQKLDPAGNRLWQEDVRVNSDGPGNVEQSEPAVALDASGNAWIAWTDKRNDSTTGDDVYAQKLSPTGTKLWSNDLRVNSDATAYTQVHPSVAASGNEAIMVWADDRNFQSFTGSNDDIFAQKLSADGAKQWGVSDLRVSSSTSSGIQSAPDVSVDASGNSYVVWQDARNIESDIFAQKLNAAGARQWNSNDVRVDDGPTAPSATYQTDPRISVQGSHLLVVWADGRNSSTTFNDVYAQKLNIGNGARLWSNDVRVNSDNTESNQFGPDVGADANGDAVVVWGDFRNSNNDIIGQKLDSTGAKQWNANDVVISNDNGRDSDYPSLAMHGSEAIVAWNDHRDASNIYAQRLSSAGSKQWAVTDVRVDTQQGPVSQFAPAVGIDATNNTYVAWIDTRYGESNVYARKLAANGTRLWDIDVRVNANDLGADSFAPALALAMDANGTIVVVWEDYRAGNTNPDLYAQRLDANGNRIWLNEVKVNSDVTSTRQSAPAIAADGSGNVIVAWADERSGTHSDVYAQKLNNTGATQWASDVKVNSDAGTAHQFNPSIGVDGSGNAVIVWEDRRNGETNDDVYAQKLNASGAKQWANDVRVNGDVGTISQRDPSVAMDGNNTFVGWNDYRNSSFSPDIFAQRLNSSGNRQWANDVRVNGDVGTAAQYMGGIASNGSGNAVVVWEDGRDSFASGNNIYAQKLNSLGNKQWLSTDVRVNTDLDSVESQYKPAVAMAANGTAVFAWEDYRNRNADMYAQSYNASGASPPLWGGDVPLIEIDRFYYLTGTAESGAVDALSGNIAAATLNADVQLNGGSARFYLSNDGGANWLVADLGVAKAFTTTGSDLRWKAVLGADPIWPRTPFVNSIQIEYTDVLPNADSYESDDTCPAAKAIAINGAAQAHTFHLSNDADWARFEVVSGTTYVVQTANAQASADTTLELYAACPQPPVATNPNTFGSDVRVTWKANLTGPVFAKVGNDNTTANGQNTGYDLAVRTVLQQPVAVIVGGRNDANTVAANIDFAADAAYRALLNAGLPKTNIRYFSPHLNRDVDGDGNTANDISGLPNPTAVRDAIQDWARQQGVKLGVPFYLYLMDHGQTDGFLADGNGSVITAEQLNLWLSNLEATSGTDNVNVIIEACKSGSFINATALGPAKISGNNRVVVVSTSDDKDAYASTQGAYFSDVFWTALGEHRDLKAAFERARLAVQAVGVLQTPWLDDNGDGVADAKDGAVARGRGLGDLVSSVPPVIDTATTGTIVNGQTLQANVRDDVGVGSVRVEIFPPGYTPPAPTADSTTRALDVPTTTLAAAGNNLFTVNFNGFTQTGVYRLVVYATDLEGNQALPFSSIVTVTTAAIPTATATATVGAGQKHFAYLPLVRR